MNGFVPAMLAALLAEVGPRSLLLARAGRRDVVMLAVVAIVAATSLAGGGLGPFLTESADALMIAISLAFAATGQLQRVRSQKALLPVIAAFWSGGTALLAFAFASRFGALTTGLGILAGLTVAALLTPIMVEAGLPARALRLASVVLLLAAAAVVAVSALRLV